GVHWFRLYFVIPVARPCSRVQGSTGVVVVAEPLELRGNRLLAHRQMQLAVGDGDVLVGEEGRLTAFPPTHPDGPLGTVKRLALEFVAHWLELRPVPFVLLVRQGVCVGHVPRGLTEGTDPGPHLLRAVIAFVE